MIECFARITGEILALSANVATIVLAVCAVWALVFARAQVREARLANRSQLTMRGGFLLELFRQWESPDMVKARAALYDLVSESAPDIGQELGRDLYEEKPFDENFVDGFTRILYAVTRSNPIQIENIKRIMRFLDLVAFLVERGFVDLDDCTPVFKRTLLDVDQLSRGYFTERSVNGEEYPEGPPETRNIAFPYVWALADKFRSQSQVRNEEARIN